jgi:hypothetical protein
VTLGGQTPLPGAVWRAMGPLALGHGLAIAAAIAVAMIVGAVVPLRAIQWGVAGVLLALGISRLFKHGHPRWVGMRVGSKDLTMWSFLMASAHGAGLMVLPLVLTGASSSHCIIHAGGAGIWPAAWATFAPTAGCLSVSAAVALVVFEKLGVGLLRKAWINLDLVWAVALIVTSIATLALAS